MSAPARLPAYLLRVVAEGADDRARGRSRNPYSRRELPDVAEVWDRGWQAEGAAVRARRERRARRAA